MYRSVCGTPFTLLIWKVLMLQDPIELWKKYNIEPWMVVKVSISPKMSIATLENMSWTSNQMIKNCPKSNIIACRILNMGPKALIPLK